MLSGARTVIALAIAYHRPPARPAPIARYARGRDYHYAHRDRMKDLRKRLLALDPTLETYASVDTGVAMEKPWAERAGLGWIGKNGCLINPRLGSWLTLSVMFVDRAVDAYDAPAERRCGDCTLCLGACPTGRVRRARRRRRAPLHRLPEHREPGRRCRRRCARASAGGSSAATSARRSAPGTTGRSPRATPASLRGRCPRWPPPRSPRWPPTSSSGWPPAWRSRASRYDGLRRNALYAIGTARDRGARAVVERLVDDPDASVRDAAAWASQRLGQDMRRLSPCDRRWVRYDRLGIAWPGSRKTGIASATGTSGR